MRNLAVALLFVLSLLSLGMAMRWREAREIPVRVEAPGPKPAVDAGSKRGQPGEDDEDEEDEEDLRPGAGRSLTPPAL